MPICWCYMICLTREEKDTKSFGGSGSSDGGRESPESEAGVRGLGLQVFGFGFLRLKKRSVLQQLMHTRASAASRSVYSRPEQSKPNPLESECSLSCLLLFTLTWQASIFSVWGGGGGRKLNYISVFRSLTTHVKTHKAIFHAYSTLCLFSFSPIALRRRHFFILWTRMEQKKKFYFQLSSAQSLFLYLKFPGQKGEGAGDYTPPHALPLARSLDTSHDQI